MQQRNPDVIVVAFYQRWLTDRRAGREHDLAHYQRLFPGYEQDLADAVATLEAEPAEEPHAGTLGHGGRFAGYRLDRVLGQGGQAVVYLAHQLDPPRPVALKILLDSRAWSSMARARFEREVELTARLQHPGICPVLARGQEQGLPWLAMPALRGQTLATRIAELACGPWRDAARTVRDAADAVAFAHAQGIVHRDLKPGNLWLAPDGRVVVLDFGLAADVQATAAEAILTRSHDRLGTPGYMAPEQLSGVRTTRRTDVFALGIVLYEVVTGQRPFPITTLTVYERSVAAGPPDPRRQRRGLPRDLSAIIAVACAPDPGQRYSDAGALRDDLDALLACRPVAAAPPSSLQHLWRWARREPVLAGTLLTLLLVLVSGLAAVWMALEKSRRDATRSALIAAASMLQQRQADAARTALSACPVDRGGFVRRLLQTDLEPDNLDTTKLPSAALVNREGQQFVVRDNGMTIRFETPAATMRSFASSPETGVGVIAITESGKPGSVVLVRRLGDAVPVRLEMPDAGVVAVSAAPDTGWVWCLVRPLGVIRRQRLEAWSVSGHERLWSREIADGRPACLLALTDHRAAVGWPDGTVQLIHADGRPDTPLFGHRHAIRRMTLTASGFATSDVEGQQRSWSEEPCGTRRQLDTGAASVRALHFEEGLRIRTGVDVEFTWDLEHDLPVPTPPGRPVPTEIDTGPIAARHPREPLHAIGLSDGSVQLRDEPSQTVLATIVSGSAAVSALAFSRDGERLAIGHDDGWITVLNVRGWPAATATRHTASAKALDELRSVGHEAGLTKLDTVAQDPWREFARRRLQHRRAGWIGDEFAAVIALPFARPALYRFAMEQIERMMKTDTDKRLGLLPSLVVAQLRVGGAAQAHALVDSTPADPLTVGLLHELIARIDEAAPGVGIPAQLAQSPLAAELRLRAEPANQAALQWLCHTMNDGASLTDMRRTDWRDAPDPLRSSIRDLFAQPTWREAGLTQALHRLLVRPLTTELHHAVADLMLGIHVAADGDRRTRTYAAAAMLRCGRVAEAHATLRQLVDEVVDWQRLEFEVAAWLSLCHAQMGNPSARRWADRAEAIALTTGQYSLIDRRLLLAEIRDNLR